MSRSHEKLAYLNNMTRTNNLQRKFSEFEIDVVVYLEGRKANEVLGSTDDYQNIAVVVVVQGVADLSMYLAMIR